MLDIIFSFGLSFILALVLIPFVIKTALHRNIVDEADERKSHTGVVPSLGGIGIFVSFTLVLLLTIPTEQFEVFRYILMALGVIFLLGAQDDLRPLSPMAKLIGQLIAVYVLVFWADIRITQFYGLFGIEAIPYALSTFISVLFYLFVINSYNLIDGINGLCSTVVILTTSLLGLWFFMIGYYDYSTLSFVVSGATLAFLKYNITPAKIFMGDTGSLVLGAVCSIIVIQFMEINMTLSTHPLKFDSPVIIAFGLMILPIYDTLRVFTIRLLEGTSPFVPDKRHLHHLMLESGLSHMQSTFTLLAFNVLMIIVALQLEHLHIVLGFIVLLSLSIIFTQVVRLIISSRPSVARSS